MGVRGPGAFAAALLLLPATMAAIQRRLLPTSETQQTVPTAVWCSGEERACWAKGTLWAGGACHAPLQQGPCADAQWLVLDARAMPRGTCAPRPCPPKQLPSAGRCLEEAEAREMCRSGGVHLDALGNLLCGESPGWPAILQTHVRCEHPSAHASANSYSNTLGDWDKNSDADASIDSDFSFADNIPSGPEHIADRKDTSAQGKSSGDAYITSYSLTDDNTTTFNKSAAPRDAKPKEEFGPFFAVVGPGRRDCARGDGGKCVPFVVRSAALHSRSAHALGTGVLCALHLTRVLR